jgi:DNA-binding transcriptional MerR regulator
MKQLIAAVLLTTALASTGYSQLQQRQRLRGPDAPVPNPQRPRAGALQDVVLGFYISQFQQVAEVNDEVFAKILPFLREFVTDRFEISARRTRSLNQIRQLTNRGASDEEIKRMIKELDQADADALANQQKFLNNADPLLTARQQAKVRIFQSMADQRIRQMLDRIQNATPNQQQQAAPNARD